MRFIILLLPLFLSAAYLKPISLEIYSNAFYLKKGIFLDENEKSFSLEFKTSNFVELKDIETNLKKECKIEDLFFKSKESFSDELSKEIENIKKEIDNLSAKKASLEINNKLLESIKFQKENLSLKSIEGISSFQKEKIFSNLKEIFSLKKRIERLRERLNSLYNKRREEVYKVFVLKGVCENSLKNAGEIKYPVRVDRKRQYNIYGDFQNKSVTVENLFLISQKSGEDLNDISLIISSYPKFRSLLPKPFYPWYIDLKRPPVFLQSRQKGMALKESLLETSKALDKISYKKSFVNEYYEISSISLKNSQDKLINLSKNSYKAKAFIEIDGYGYSKPFITFKFDTDRFYPEGKAKFYLDNSFTGYGYFKINKKTGNKLYFGEDLKISVDKKLIKDFSKEPIFSLDKVKTTKIWNYKVKNNHKKNVKVKLIERAPVSKNEKIEVKIIAKPKYDVLEKNGKVIWSFVLNPKESKEIVFGYEIEKPKGY